jgi:3-hydroxyisobutyryl-CoA hydrolase
MTPLPDDDPQDVIFTSIYGLRSIELNRPKKLNSLNGSMARKMLARLQVPSALASLAANAYIFRRNGRNQT